MNKVNELISIMKIGRNILEEMKNAIGEEDYNKIMSEPMKSCSCGYIKEGDETMCPKCELVDLNSEESEK